MGWACHWRQVVQVSVDVVQLVIGCHGSHFFPRHFWRSQTVRQHQRWHRSTIGQFPGIEEGHELFFRPIGNNFGQVGAWLGGAAGGVGYALTHSSCNWNAQDFQHAIDQGIISGGVAGGVGAAVGAALPTATLSQTIFAGSAGGALSSAAGQIAMNLNTPGANWNDNLGEAAIIGGLAGGFGSGIGYEGSSASTEGSYCSFSADTETLNVR